MIVDLSRFTKECSCGHEHAITVKQVWIEENAVAHLEELLASYKHPVIVCDENTKKAYVIDRLSDNLACDLDDNIDKNYCDIVMDSFGENPVFIIDDSDIIKPLGEKFEDLGIVRDGSSKNKNYEKGYHVTEIVGLTKDKRQPISVFSKIHSYTSKEYI